MKQDFDNRVALVTGGSFGIGRAAAIAFAKLGARVIIADWKKDPEDNTIRQIEEAGGKVHFFTCDVSDPAQVKKMFAAIVASFGRLDFAFNNAGVEGVQAPVHTCDEADWDRTIDINLKGVWLCMKEEIQHMRAHGKGVIVNCSSVAGLQGFANLPAYVASKHGVLGLTKAAALENAQSGIRINAVCPGVVRTPMVERVIQGDEEMERLYTALEPIGRMGKPEEIAAAVIWLCSDAASFVTGIAMPVDGGLMAG